ncbi:30S ribosomal protein S9 [Candidatus Shapirobacteria bacterium CG08_land_8_20_14_0_20_39_18]|uniref:30S ribosomal protein S9 n=1 Tax=Candidatus Shapirobacteria bacterium CG08_land_8_20_14_0_20_39_18 TaxID=1974883 RepID=A0A2M6XEB6_9BACT|nr:MAG: 30S ribosomal protein S9 [Candidatus Shapirobacteria bacterium CG08_land_8_20_14_0_20_39_18]PIY66432.1 MAG: 30S ribosomal protein S9 [Candidatus Shapirobacteria bacterium CG_4_10_14_0_8_um_filter_39_15]PJE68404.1 MAG: 30S ribosomal protein S9 [Candidatus Shapirobacteria bacterium CG10_big_fil_rev_8_21_14_0_10_38_8]
MPRTKKEEKPKYISVVGSRREAQAKVRLYAGKGETTVNGIPIEKYFPQKGAEKLFFKPFEITNTMGKYFATIKCEGGGKVGQIAAVIHGLSRALSLADKEKFRPDLKKAKLLTRDSRTRQRRNIGMGGKSRRKKQSPKR